MKEKKETREPAEEVAAAAEEPLPQKEPETPGEEPAASLPLEAAFAAFLASLSETDRAAVTAFLTQAAARDRAGHAAAEEERCLSALSTHPAFAGIEGQRAEMDALIGQVGWLRDLPIYDRLVAAFYLCRGMAAGNESEEERLTALLSDPALMRALATKKAEMRAAGRTEIAPAVVGRAPACLPKPPKNLAEAGNATRQYFNIKR